MVVNPWTEDEVNQLYKNYLNKPIEKLRKIIKRSEFGITSKLEKLAKEKPKEWDKQRIKFLVSRLHREYRRNCEQYSNEKYDYQEIEFLKESYLTKSAEEIARELDRGKWGVVAKLQLLAKENPNQWNKKRIRYLLNDLLKEKYAITHPDKRNYWNDGEIEDLKNNYKHKSLEELSKITERSKWGLIQKLKKLEKFGGWDKKAIRKLYSEAHRDYRHSNKEKLKNYREEKKRFLAESNLIYKKFLEREGEWVERDITVLANTYFNHNIKELAEIFWLKKTGVNNKLRELYQQDSDSWDIDRINELEGEAKKYSISKNKLEPPTDKFFKYFTKIKRLKRRPEIDELIERGLNMRQIGKKLGVTHQAIEYYLGSRDLKEEYKVIQNKKYNESV